MRVNSEFFKETGICPQDEIVWDSLSVHTHLKMICLIKNIDYEYLKVWLKMMDMDRFTGNCPAELSSGMKRKLQFMMSAIFNPQYKFLDEPTTGLDPLARKRFREIIQFQKKVYGASSVFTTHTMNEAEKTCDRIMILINGQTCVIDKVENLKRMTGGYNLSVVKSNKENLKDPEILAGKISQIFGIDRAQLRIVQDSSQKITFDITGQTTVGDKFQRLQQLVKNEEIVDFTLTRKSLEDLFLLLSQNQRVQTL